MLSDSDKTFCGLRQAMIKVDRGSSPVTIIGCGWPRVMECDSMKDETRLVKNRIIYSSYTSQNMVGQQVELS